ncbi:ribosomal subunit interface protein [Actinopolyspora erythraea]|uniref:Ribosome hibernation promoting factor n=1 Tax=Actinopolyspora erythraea TaxID=414996 RepID=A0A099D2V9_9ACTN|nr:ribosome-associated translation inhibitor RaiA [Actinopolyspora erythraea]ASU77659.1 ribosomal subunit interface protein [Actinopolyspora erythraea]KGI80498.1 30S ribosomal protein S30 [Actinopolyspora erythraea]
MDIVVKGRNVEVPSHYQQHVGEKLSRLDRYDRKAMRADVELHHERNPRQAKNCQRVEITLRGRGPAVRAEASAPDFYAALDAASTKLENRLRKMHDRRKVHYGRRNPRSVAEATAAMADRPVAVAGAGGTPRGQSRTTLLEPPAEQPRDDRARGSSTVSDSAVGNQRTSQQTEPVSGDSGVPRQREDINGYEPGRIVREKEHPATPMTVDQALYEMELVGHDFYLFFDADADKPSVVYRRKGFDYGVIRLA